jgi:type II secretory pathway component PulM
MEGGSAHRLARRTIEAVASVWHAPRQRRLLLALIAAVLSAFAFAHIAEDYLTNDPSHART